MIRFICGCSSHLNVPTTTDLLKTFDGIGHDAEGFIVCSIHRQRRQGWRSVPYTATTAPVSGMGQWTELEYEKFILFGEIPMFLDIPVKGSPGIEDIRDNRDPATVSSGL